MNPQRNSWRTYAQIILDAAGLALLIGLMWLALATGASVAGI